MIDYPATSSNFESILRDVTLNILGKVRTSAPGSSSTVHAEPSPVEWTDA